MNKLLIKIYFTILIRIHSNILFNINNPHSWQKWPTLSNAKHNCNESRNSSTDVYCVKIQIRGQLTVSRHQNDQFAVNLPYSLIK